MKQILFLLSLSCLFLIPCFAQENIPCPNIIVTTPNKTIEPGSTIYFSVSAGEELKNLKLEYKWKISHGRIERGQETPDLVISSGGLHDLYVIATVEIKGLPQNCPNTFSGTAVVGARPTHYTTTEEFDLSDPQVMKARLDNFYTALINKPTARGVIITYGTKMGIDRREAEIRRIIRLKKYNIKRFEFVRTIREHEVITRFYLVPAGTKAPVPEP